MQPLRITIVCPSLRGGGAERAIVLLTRGFMQTGHDVTIVTLYKQDSDLFKLPPGANRIALGIAGDSRNFVVGAANNLRRMRVLRRTIRGTKPDVVVSHMCQTNVITAIALTGLGCPLIVVEHSDPATNAKSKIWERLRRISYPRVAKVVSVSAGINDYFFWLASAKRTVVHNPVERPTTKEPIDHSHKLDHLKKRLVAMGRLIHVKGFDRLLPAFAKIAVKHSDWELLILGEGELRPELEEMRAQLGLIDAVHLPGFSQNPFPLLRDAEIFVMSSRAEGFPYALLEAMSCGLPAVAMDCDSGPREIIRDGVDGILVSDGDIDGLAATLDRLMTDELACRTLAARAPEVLERFGLAKTIALWETLFTEVTKTDGK